MDATHPKDAMHRAAAYAVLSLLVAILTYRFRAYCVDDGFIFARYAAHLASGQGWTFNAGDPVNATTSILWTILLVPLAWAKVLSIGALAVVSGAAILSLALAVFELLVESDPWLRLSAAIVVASSPLLWGALGLETAFAVSLVAWSFVAASRERPTAAGILLGLAVLARPDALAAAPLLVFIAARKGRRPSPKLLWALVPIVLWSLIAWRTFGTPLPATLRAKIQQSDMGWWATQGGFLQWAVAELPFGVATLLGVVLAVFGARHRPLAPALALVAYGAIHAVAYQLMRVPPGYSWYVIPLAIACVVGPTVFAEAVAQRVGPDESRRRRVVRVVALAANALIAVMLLDATRKLPARYRFTDEYTRAAAYLDTQAPPNATVACTEIGYLGFFGKRPIVDIHGLIHPSAIADVRRDPEWWLARRPDFVVRHVPAWYGEGTPALLSEYDVVTRVVGPDGEVEILRHVRASPVTSAP